MKQTEYFEELCRFFFRLDDISSKSRFTIHLLILYMWFGYMMHTLRYRCWNWNFRVSGIRIFVPNLIHHPWCISKKLFHSDALFFESSSKYKTRKIPFVLLVMFNIEDNMCYFDFTKVRLGQKYKSLKLTIIFF